MDFEASKRKVAALVWPRNVVIVGASDRPGSMGAMVRANLRRYGYSGPVYLINPRRDEIDGEPCYKDFASLPDRPDHLTILVPSVGVCDVLREAGKAEARSATIFSAGFGESFDKEGVRLGAQLREVIAQTGIAVSGPNCMGNLVAKSRLMTLALNDPYPVREGPVAMVGHSGGVMLYVSSALEERGMDAGYLITNGNEAGLTIADYIAFFADQPELKVILIYVEGIRDTERFKAACRLARAAGKTVVAVKLGRSDDGKAAALAHTGSIAGAWEDFAALADEAGIVLVDNLDDAIEATELLVHTGAPQGRRLGAITLSGAFRGLLLDAADQHDLQFPELDSETVGKLQSLLTAGTLISNPVDGGYSVLASGETFLACIDALNGDPGIDMILLQEALPSRPGSARAEKFIKLVEEYVATRAKKPIAYITLTSHSQSDYSRALRAQAPHVSFLHEANKSLRAIGSIARAEGHKQAGGRGKRGAGV